MFQAQEFGDDENIIWDDEIIRCETESCARFISKVSIIGLLNKLVIGSMEVMEVEED